MNLNNSAFFIIFLFLQFLGFGQKDIAGTIKDSNTGEVVPFVYIYVEGRATISDENGCFILPLEASTSKVIFSAIGYEEKSWKSIKYIVLFN